ncbi:hypothetical protein GA0070615_0001 [Micromonospora aurantiaca]|nr:hypothetical protein GA0070615_0001 [Micromonospora aurantiaca]
MATRSGPPTGVWLGASHIHGRPVTVDEPYPHICHHRVAIPGTRETERIGSRGCAACNTGGERPALRLVHGGKST